MEPAARSEERLRRSGIVCLVAVLAHGADHARRGIDVVTTQVASAGAIQLVLVALTVWLVFRNHHWAPSAAIAVGFAGAIGFGAAHLLPHWSSFSDPFRGTDAGLHVNALSWASALFEIGADLALGWAGVRIYAADQTRTTMEVSR
jgi:hypothetical protein